MDDAGGELIPGASEAQQQPTPPPQDSQVAGPAERHSMRSMKQMDTEDEAAAPDIPSPISADGEKHDERELSALHSTDLGSPSLSYDFSNVRLIPSPTSPFFRAGSRFHGTQQSERQVYEVQVEIKHVDMRESFLCGYLRIQGLTPDHPTLTTYFEGELIGSKYTFLTEHKDWGSTELVDHQHWTKFSAFSPYKKHSRKMNIQIPGWTQRDNIFMRWKEKFLVPDHRVRTLNGASFEGFYYICFNQKHGTINGIYFHAKSERFQHLDLKHVPDRGCFAAREFR